MRDSHSIELACLKKEWERRRKKNIASSWFGTFTMLSCATGSLIGWETLEDEWCVVVKAYMLIVSEILRDFFVLSYVACPRYPCI